MCLFSLLVAVWVVMHWLLLVAHDTNIAMVRTLMDFSWQLPGYSRGNIPPGSSLVLERWRVTPLAAV